MRNTSSRLILAAIGSILPGVAVGQAATYRAGQSIQLADGLKVRAVDGQRDAFPEITVSGVGRVFDLQFEKTPGLIVVLEPSTDMANSGIVLHVGDTRLAPKALTSAAQQGGKQQVVMINDLVSARDTGRGAWFGFSARPQVQFLFDVPHSIADKPARLAIDVLINGKNPPIRVEIIN